MLTLTPVDPSIAAPTEIYVNEQTRYPGGYTVHITAAMHVSQARAPNRLLLTVAATAKPAPVTVVITPLA